MIPKPLRDFQKKVYNQEFKEYNRMNQSEIVEKILEICAKE
jgi:hypothetical protein